MADEDDFREGLLRGGVETLRPIVQRLLAHGAPFGQLEARLRELFVEVAERDFALPERPQTDSRISLLTGINRKEVRRIRSADRTKPAPGSFSRNLAASLVSRWLNDRRSTDRSGHPRPIPYRAERGPSFVELAREVTVDLPPRAILDELVRTGAAEIRDGDLVALRSDAYVPKLGQSEKLGMLAEDPAELVETMLRNIVADAGDLLLQRKVYYDNLGVSGLGRVREQVRREGERFLRRVDRLLSKFDRDRNAKAPGGDRQYAGVGVYYFEAPEVSRSVSDRKHPGRSPVSSKRVEKRGKKE